MTTELQNQAWASLPEDFKKEVSQYYNHLVATCSNEDMEVTYRTIALIFGKHNLTAPSASECGNLNEDSEDCDIY